MEHRTCRLVTLGCKVNQYETQLVKEALEQNGYREATEDEAADLCVVNTCTVTGTGDAKSRQVIRQLAAQNPGTRTLVMGCYATRDPQSVSRLPSVFEVVRDKRELGDVLARQGIVDIPRGISHFEGRKRAFVKVQDGCILKCTYCIIPFVRPGLASRSPDDIEDEVRRLVDNGYREIVLSAASTSGTTASTQPAESPVCRRFDCGICSASSTAFPVPGGCDYRASKRLKSTTISSRPQPTVNIFVHNFIPLCKAVPRPSCCACVAATRCKRFLEKIERMRERLDHPAFTTDMIVGFPGETEDDFEQSLAVCRQVGFMKMHVFPFSARTGTKAAEFPNQVAADSRFASGSLA